MTCIFYNLLIINFGPDFEMPTKIEGTLNVNAIESKQVNIMYFFVFV